MKRLNRKRSENELPQTQEKTPEQIKAEKEGKRKASLMGALKSYHEADDQLKHTKITIRNQRFQEEFPADKSHITYNGIQKLMEEYGERNMQTILDTIKVLYSDLLNEENGAYYYYDNIINSCLGLSQSQLDLITPEVLNKWKEIIDNQNFQFDERYKNKIIGLKNFFTMGDTLYSVAVKKDIHWKEAAEKEAQEEEKRLQKQAAKEAKNHEDETDF